ncbi:MAG: hypothetical protein HC866_09350 [Leptolyngbyaceae cyanobacterium RU_5_1]|nr:hypothetical protein [Leptolyngbyaceae cyanobacterium RU_5_1]
MEAAIETVQLAAAAKTIQIVAQLSSRTIAGDVDRLQQVVSNLLSNAIKFTPANGRVEVRLEQVEGGRVDEWEGGRVDMSPFSIDPSTHPLLRPDHR